MPYYSNDLDPLYNQYGVDKSGATTSSSSSTSSSGSGLGSSLGSSLGDPSSSSSSSGSSNDPTLFWGWGTQTVPPPTGKTVPIDDAQGKATVTGTAFEVKAPQEKSLSAAVKWFMRLPYTNKTKYDEIRKLMDQAGLVSKSSNLDTASQAFATFAYNIGMAYEKTGKQRTPEQWLQYLAQNAKDTPGSASFTGSKTTTSSHVTTISPSQSRGLAEQTFQSELGHAPSKAERVLLRADMNDRARSNPAVTTTTTDYKKGQATDSHSVTDGSPDFNQMALNEARSKPGYAEYQAINYMDTLEQMLGAVGGA